MQDIRKMYPTGLEHVYDNVGLGSNVLLGTNLCFVDIRNPEKPRYHKTNLYNIRVCYDKNDSTFPTIFEYREFASYNT